MTTTSTGYSTNPEKIILVEKLIKKNKITLEEGLLLLSEVVTTITPDWNYLPTQYPPSVIYYSGDTFDAGSTFTTTNTLENIKN